MKFQLYKTLFEQLLELNCTTGLELGIGNVLAAEHKKRGYHVELQEVAENRFNIWAFHPSEQESDRVLMSSHIDTVPPHLDWRLDGEAYYGRGACDTKGGIIAQLAAGDAVKDSIPVDYLWVVGEETDHIGAKAAEQKRAAFLSNRQHAMVILCEPTDNRLAHAQKGIAKATIKFVGKNAHSGYPHLGEDANKRMIEYAQFMYDLGVSLKDELYGDFDINVGLISGGTAANVVSDHAEFTFLARSNSQHNFFKQQVELFLKQGESIQWGSENAPKNFDHVQRLNYKNTYVAKFNTDAMYLSAIAPVYLMGPGYIIHAHAPKEHIKISEIEAGTDLYIQLMRDVLK
jgi:acetylornithine deacetylase